MVGSSGGDCGGAEGKGASEDFFQLCGKYRKDTGTGYPEEAVHGGKQKKIRRTASYYMYSRGLGEETPCRFDVVAITGSEIRVIRNAF